MSNLNQKFSEMSKLAKEFDNQALDFVRQMNDLAQDIEDRLNRRRKKYQVDVRIDQAFDFSRYQIDFFISTKDSDSIYYVFTIDLDGDLDEDEILKLLDDYFKEELN